MSEDKFGLDIGTWNIRLSSLSAGTFISEKNFIAVKDKKYIIGYGNDAFDMYERAPENIDVDFPVHDSVISEIDKMQMILEYIYKKLNRGKNIKGGHFLISVPTDTTEVEKRAFHELVANSKLRARSISMVEKSVADAIGCGIDIKSPKGNFIVNMGADTTDLTVMSLGSIVINHSVKIAGRKFDEAIINAVKQTEQKLIGYKTAEALKINLADMGEKPEPGEMKIFASQMASGLPARTIISSDLVNNAVKGALMPLLDLIRNTLEKTPPELAADIIENGIYLLGGSASMKNIGSLFARVTGIKVKLLKDPANSTIRGVTTILNNSRFDSVRYIPKEKEYN
ncbi:MAG: rod shape-determining protein [Parasporobacterium sp.]|nr:rod shape-determining protein [Parasporobacterium sp.]